MAYHDEDLIDLDVFDIHHHDGEDSIHSIDAADQRPIHYRIDPTRSPRRVDANIVVGDSIAETIVLFDEPGSCRHEDDEIVEHHDPNGYAEDNVLPEAPTVSSTPDNRNNPRLDGQPNTKKHVDWSNPTLMIMSLLAGIGFAVGHHFYYRWLNGKQVGDSHHQQWPLRIGTGFAWLVALFLKTSIGVAYIHLEYNLWSFWNWELKSGMPLATALALVLWRVFQFIRDTVLPFDKYSRSIPISTLIPPATLSTKRSVSVNASNEMVPTIGISDHSLEPMYTHGFNFTKAMFPKLELYPGIARLGFASSPAVARVASAAAITGTLVPLKTPTTYQNVPYSMFTYLPLLRCKQSNTSVQHQMATMARSYWSGLPSPHTFDNLTWNTTHGCFTIEIGYLSVVPAVIPESGNRVLLQTQGNRQYSSAQQTLGELWTALSIYDESGKQEEIEFLTCELYNASITLSIELKSSLLTISNLEVDYIQMLNPSALNFSDTSHAYAAYAGWFDNIASFYTGLEARSDPFDYIGGSKIVQSQLMASSQFYKMYHRMWTGLPPSPGADPSLRNHSFSDDIEEFSLNVSLSLLSDPSLCQTVVTEVTTTSEATVYHYEPSNLFIAYGLAILFSTFSVLIGIYALWQNGVSHNASVSTFAIAMQDDEVKEALGMDNTCSMPLDKRMSKMRLRFDGDGRFKLKG